MQAARLRSASLALASLFAAHNAAVQMPRYVSRKHDLAIDHHRDRSLKQINRDNYFTGILHLRKDSLNAA